MNNAISQKYRPSAVITDATAGYSHSTKSAHQWDEVALAAITKNYV
jgi:hypothetical protein